MKKLFSDPLPDKTKVFVSDVHLFGDLKKRMGVVTGFNVNLEMERRKGVPCIQYLVNFGYQSYWFAENQIEGYLFLNS